MKYERFDGSCICKLNAKSKMSMLYHWIDCKSRQVAVAKAERDAVHAGRLAQIDMLVAALAKAVPDHQLLRATGLAYANGEPAYPWQRPFEDAFDRIAIANAIPPAVRPRLPVSTQHCTL